MARLPLNRASRAWVELHDADASRMNVADVIITESTVKLEGAIGSYGFQLGRNYFENDPRAHVGATAQLFTGLHLPCFNALERYDDFIRVNDKTVGPTDALARFCEAVLVGLGADPMRAVLAAAKFDEIVTAWIDEMEEQIPPFDGEDFQNVPYTKLQSSLDSLAEHLEEIVATALGYAVKPNPTERNGLGNV